MSKNRASNFEFHTFSQFLKFSNVFPSSLTWNHMKVYFCRNTESQAANRCHATRDSTPTSGKIILSCKKYLTWWKLFQVNRDTLYVLLNFLHLVSENSEDRKGAGGEELTGNKMDSNNLATLFAPNILHSMKPGEGAISPDTTAKAAERTETINIVRTLIDFNKELFELGWEELHSLYTKMHDEVPEAMDYLLRRRALMNGDEFVEEFEGNVLFDMPEPRLIGPNMDPFDHSQER